MSQKKRYQKKSQDTLEMVFTGYMNESMNFAYSVVKRYLTDYDDVKDTIQAAYIKAWKSFPKYDAEQSSFTTWLFTILKNECIDKLRMPQTKINKNDVHRESVAGPNESDISDERELYQIILELAEKLSPAQREIFILRDIREHSIKEVVEITGQSEGSIKTNLYLARKNIKQWMIKGEII